MTDSSLKSVLRLLQSAQLVEARLAGGLSAIHGLSVNEMLPLMQLDSAPLKKLPRVDLAKRLNMSASTVTRMSAPLEKCGLVTRQSDPRDARLAFVVLTDTGATRLAETRATLTQQSASVFRDRWDSAEIDQLAELRGRLGIGSPGNLT